MYTSATEPKNTWSEHKPGDFRDLQNGQHKWTSFMKCFLCFAQLSCHIHIRWKHNGCYYYYCWLLQDGQQTTTWQVSWQTSIPQPPPHVPSIAKPSSRSSYCGCKSQIGFSSRLDDCKHRSGKNCWCGQCLLWLKKKKKKAQPVDVMCQIVPVFSLSGKSFFGKPIQLFPGAHLARVWWAGNWCGKKRQMQYFFLFSFFSCRKCDMHAQRLWWSAENAESRGQSVPLQDLAGAFVRRGLLPSFLFQRVRVIAVVAVTLSFNSYLLALLSRENVVDNGCVLSSAQVLFFMFRVTHLVVFIAFLL